MNDTPNLSLPPNHTIPVDYNHLAAAWLSGRFAVADIATAALTDEVKRVVSNYNRQLRAMVQKGYGLYAYGPNGSGKTYALASCLRQGLSQRFTALMITADRLRASSMNDKDRYRENCSVWERAKGVHILLVDSLGSEFLSEKSSYTQDMFHALLRERNAAPYAVTLFTSHLEPTGPGGTSRGSKLAAVYGEDVAALISEMSFAVKVDSLDYRASIQQDMRALLLGGEDT